MMHIEKIGKEMVWYTNKRTKAGLSGEFGANKLGHANICFPEDDFYVSRCNVWAIFPSIIKK
jgi:hypothetical protein